MRFFSRPGQRDAQRQHFERQQRAARPDRRQPQLPGQAQHDQPEQAAQRPASGCQRRRRRAQGGVGRVIGWHDSRHDRPAHRPDGTGPTQPATLLQTLSHCPWLDTARTLRERFREDRLGLTASSLTFTTLIALVPLFTVMLAVFTAFPMFAKLQDALQKTGWSKPGARQHRASQVLGYLTQFAGQGQPAGRGRPGGAAGHGAGADADHRPHAQRHLARAQAAAAGAAGAGVLGRASRSGRWCWASA